MRSVKATKAEIASDILDLLTEDEYMWYVNSRGKPDNWAPTREDVYRALMARTRDQLWRRLDELTKPS